MTGYAAGMREYHVTIVNRKAATAGRFGLDGAGVEWQDGPTVHAAVDWAKGMRTLNAGAVDAYAVVLVRMDWNDVVTMRSRIRWDGQVYQVLPETFHANKRANTIQFNAQLVVNE